MHILSLNCVDYSDNVTAKNKFVPNLGSSKRNIVFRWIQASSLQQQVALLSISSSS